MPTTVEGHLAASTSADRAPRTLFVTNDFPPRIGGAQSYYWGVIRTLDPSEVAILAPAHIDAAAFDATHPYTVVRASTSVLWPTNAMLHTVEQMAEREGAELIQLGHPLPAGLLGPRLRQRRGLPYVVFLGGAEVTLPGVVPGVNNLLRHVLGNASMLLTVSEYTAEAARKQTGGKVPAEVLRPPLLVDDFVPADREEAACLRERMGVDGQLVVCVGRLVPRKGQDKLIDALALLRSEFPRLHLVLIGEGRLATGLYDRAQKRGRGRARAPHRRAHRQGDEGVAARRRRVRLAVPQPLGRSRGGGLRHRVRRGRARRPAGDRRRLRRRAGGRDPGRYRPRGRRPLGPAGRGRAGARSCGGRRSSAGTWAPGGASSPWRGTPRRSSASATASCCAGRPASEPPRRVAADCCTPLLGLGAGFAAGTIPTGELVTRALTGQRLQDLGDGKAGSSNVARSVGWKAGAAVLALDALKAYAPATASRLHGAGDNEVAAVGIAAMCGHIAVVKGRGAASALGAAFAMDPAMMAVGCVPLVGGSLLHRHAEAVTITALSLPRHQPRAAPQPAPRARPARAHHRAVRGAPPRLGRRAASRLPRGPLEPVLARPGRALEAAPPCA